jgi:hypothetical protein
MKSEQKRSSSKHLIEDGRVDVPLSLLQFEAHVFSKSAVRSAIC